jgi:formylglycine-generating enzyme required for sulfatase activity
VAANGNDKCANSGSSATDVDNTIPAHLVRLSPFFMDQTEVTNAQYRQCVDDMVCPPPGDCIPGAPFASLAYGCRYEQPEHDDLPVVAVTWDAARRYCAYVGKRLPSEAQWERAAVGPRPLGEPARQFPWGDDRVAEGRAHAVEGGTCSSVLEDGPRAVHGVDRVDGRSAEGIYDLVGNVREWTLDDHDPEVFCLPGPRNPDEWRPRLPNDCGGTPECVRTEDAPVSGLPRQDPVVDRGGALKVVRGGAFCSTTLARMPHDCDLNARARMGLDKDFKTTDLPSQAMFLAGLLNEAQVTGFRCVRLQADPEPPRRGKACETLDTTPRAYTPPTSGRSSSGESSSAGGGSSSGVAPTSQAAPSSGSSSSRGSSSSG